MDLQLLPMYATFFFNVVRYLANQLKEGRVCFGWQVGWVIHDVRYPRIHGHGCLKHLVTEKVGHWYSALYLLFLQFRTPTHGMVQFTIQVGLPSNVKPVRNHPHRNTQRCDSQSHQLTMRLTSIPAPIPTVAQNLILSLLIFMSQTVSVNGIMTCVLQFFHLAHCFEDLFVMNCALVLYCFLGLKIFSMYICSSLSAPLVWFFFPF